MKHQLLRRSFFLLALLFLPVLVLRAQVSPTAPCDTCTSPWSPPIQKVFLNQNVQGMSLSCYYNIYLTIQTRICNGKIQVRCLNMYYNKVGTDPYCDIKCTFYLFNLWNKAVKLLIVDLGGNIVVNKPSTCYYALEYQLTPALENCMGSEAGLHPKWFALLPCGSSCCITEYQLLANGDVRAVSSSTSPCVGTPPMPVPTTLTVYCWQNGVMMPFTVPVVPPTAPLDCINVCHTNGDIFTARNAPAAVEGYESNALFYPNPAYTELTIAPGVGWKSVVVSDISGRVVMQQSYSGSVIIDISGLCTGTYIAWLQLENGDKEHFKFVKK